MGLSLRAFLKGKPVPEAKSAPSPRDVVPLRVHEMRQLPYTPEFIESVPFKTDAAEEFAAKVVINTCAASKRWVGVSLQHVINEIIRLQTGTAQLRMDSTAEAGVRSLAAKGYLHVRGTGMDMVIEPTQQLANALFA